MVELGLRLNTSNKMALKLKIIIFLHFIKIMMLKRIKLCFLGRLVMDLLVKWIGFQLASVE